MKKHARCSKLAKRGVNISSPGVCQLWKKQKQWFYITHHNKGSHFKQLSGMKIQKGGQA